MEFTISETFSYFGRLLHMSREQVVLKLTCNTFLWKHFIIETLLGWESARKAPPTSPPSRRWSSGAKKNLLKLILVRCELWAGASKDDFHWRWLSFTNLLFSFLMNPLWVLEYPYPLWIAMDLGVSYNSTTLLYFTSLLSSFLMNPQWVSILWINPLLSISVSHTRVQLYFDPTVSIHAMDTHCDSLCYGSRCFIQTVQLYFDPPTTHSHPFWTHYEWVPIIHVPY